MWYRLLEEQAGHRKFVLALEVGDETIETITAFAQKESLGGASLSGIGAFSHSVLGYFNPETEEFVQNRIDMQTEVVSMTGNIATEGGDKPKLHLHVVLACRDASTRGGHLVAGWARPTLEVIIEEVPQHLKRGIDEKTRLVLLQP